MKKLTIAGLIAILAACGAEGDPTAPNFGLGLGIGPGGLRVTPNVSVRDPETGAVVRATPGGVRAGASAGPVGVGASL